MRGRILVVFFISLALFRPLFCENKRAMEAGKNFGKSQIEKTKHSIERFSVKNVFGEIEEFDPKDAKEKVESYRGGEGKIPSKATKYALSEKVRSNKAGHLIQEDLLLKRTEDILDGKIHVDHHEKKMKETVETCLKEGDPFLLTLKRELEVDVEYREKIVEESKICLGHERTEKFDSKREAKEEREWERRKFANNPTIRSFSISDIIDPGWSHRYQLISTWTHKDGTAGCNKYVIKYVTVQEESWEKIGQNWVYRDQKKKEIAFSTRCSFVQSDCIDNASKTIHGKKVEKRCWMENLIFLCEYPKRKKRDFLSKKNCQFLSKKCLEKSDFGCALWELKYTCRGLNKKTFSSPDETIFGIDSENWETECEDNTDFSKVASTLAFFDEMQKELSNSKEVDPSKIRIFKGNEKKCKKSSLSSDILYDCCFSYSGLAKQVGLAKCTADEIALAEMRDKGLCHQVGKYSEKFAGMIKTDDVHVFCCFDSKISRVFQEEGRKQLGLSWGTAKNPMCRGLTQKEIGNVDFSKIDLQELSECFPRKIPKKFGTKVSSLQEKIKKRIEKNND